MINKSPLDEIRELDLVNYLESIGYQPEKIRKNDQDYWYLSPLRNESEPSFKIDRKINRWFDFGLGEGGNTIDFCLRFFKCNISELIEKFRTGFFFQQHGALPSFSNDGLEESDRKISITGEQTLSSLPLIYYLQDRRIPIAIAEKFCREVTYNINGKSFYGIGFKNNSGGYEIRNAFFKCSSSPKDLTTITNRSNEVQIFEGFFDLLSFQTIYENDPLSATDCLVLNGAAMFERARPELKSYTTKRLWLDRDKTGMAYTKSALDLNEGYIDESIRYRKFKDCNEWLVSGYALQRQRSGHRLRGLR